MRVDSVGIVPIATIHSCGTILIAHGRSSADALRNRAQLPAAWHWRGKTVSLHQFSKGTSSQGNNAMPRVRACPRGHEWEVADDRAAPANDTRCPVCGSAAHMIPADVGRDGSSTILLPSDWQPIPSLNSDPPPNIPGFQILGELGRGG